MLISRERHKKTESEMGFRDKEAEMWTLFFSKTQKLVNICFQLASQVNFSLKISTEITNFQSMEFLVRFLPTIQSQSNNIYDLQYH